MRQRAAVYARVSTTEQSENGYGLDFQISDCLDYAERNGFQVIETLKDDTSGTTKLDERQGGQRLLNLVVAREIDSVIVWKLDRLARPPQGEYSRLLTIIEHFNRFGVAVYDCDGGKNDPMDLAGGLMAFLNGYHAGKERQDIIERTTRGKRQRAKAGNWIGILPPFGYDKIGNGKNARLVINDQESLIVRQIFEHYVGWGKRKKMSVRAIAKMLTEKRIPTPGSKRNMETSGIWTISGIRERILKNKRYVGKIKSYGFVLDMPELAIVDTALFEEVQKQLELNKRRHHQRRAKEFYLLSGNFTCYCGRALVGSNASVRNADGNKVYYRYYRCSGRYGAARNCTQKNLRADEIDAIAWNWVSGLLLDDECLDAGLDEMERKSREEAIPTRQELETVESLISKTESKIKRLVSAFGDTEDNVVSAAMKEEINSASTLLDHLRREQERLNQKIAKVEFGKDTRDVTKKLAQRVRRWLGKASNCQKRQLFDALELEARLIECESGKLALRLTCILDSETFCIGDGCSWSPATRNASPARSWIGLICMLRCPESPSRN